MKFGVDSEVRSVITGLVGVVLRTVYTIKVDNSGEIRETINYQIKWKNSSATPQWMQEHQLSHPSEKLKTENEYIAEMSILEQLIDSSLVKGDEKSFKEYAGLKNELTEEMEIRGFIKKQR